MLGLFLEPTLVWTAVGLSTAGLALRVPAAPPREAAAVARTVDSVASSPTGYSSAGSSGSRSTPRSSAAESDSDL